jgi:hypothetical protein
VLLLVLPALAGPGRGNSGAQLPHSCSLPVDFEAVLINAAFTDRLYGGPLRLPSAESIEDISGHISDMYLPVELLPDAYSLLLEVESGYECLDTPDCEYNTFFVTYDIDGRRYTAHSFFREAQSEPGEYAAVVIPGSGQNQSSAIYSNDPYNYHYNVAELLHNDWDMYVCVKPNEDFLAIYNGPGKLNYEYIVSYLINLGGSYSGKYLVDTLAMVKHLRAKYDKVVVIGISQGGQTTLYNALQSNPDGAIIASGFSALHERLVRAGLGQVIIPGMMDYLANDKIFEGIQNTDTEYLFSWGWRESGTYGIDARVGCTRDFLAPLLNTTSVIHGEGHVFPESAVTWFLQYIATFPGAAAAEHTLFQNVPNPFVMDTQISFWMRKEAHARLQVFDAKGRLVRVLVDEVLKPMRYVEVWDGTDSDGRRLPSGTYFCRLELPGWSSVKKMTLVR